MVSSAFLISQILIIVAAAGICSWLLTTSGIPQQILGGIEALRMRPWETLLLINIGLLLAGSFLEPPAAILILGRYCRARRRPASVRSTSASSWPST